MAIEKAIERLGDGKYRNLDDSTVLLLIKHLVHFLPDMHCPAHVIYNYRPSNYWVEINGRKELFHSVWDNMPSYGPHAWSVSEWGRYLGHCTKEERAEMVEGTPREWVADNARNCIVAYDIVRPDENVSDPDRYRGNLLAEQQLQKGGFRLAHVLNSIFGRAFRAVFPATANIRGCPNRGQPLLYSLLWKYSEAIVCFGVPCAFAPGFPYLSTAVCGRRPRIRLGPAVKFPRRERHARKPEASKTRRPVR